MLKPRVLYFLLFVFTIIAGILSRHFAVIPLFIGDLLYATMIYWLVRLLLAGKPMVTAALISITFCYCIEISQLYKAAWIDELRQTLFGRLVLGNTFLWGDLVCYTIGVATGLLLDKILMKYKR